MVVVSAFHKESILILILNESDPDPGGRGEGAILKF